jgi:hypothetical protein
MKLNLNLERMCKCPKFFKCNASQCPLDARRGMRVKFPADAVCTLSKNKRLHLGRGLPHRGLTPKEFAGTQTWRNRSSESRAATLKKLAIAGEINGFGSRKTPLVKNSDSNLRSGEGK